MSEVKRTFTVGRKGTVVYCVNGVWLDRRDLINHLLCWARDNSQSEYPQEVLAVFLQDILDLGYASKENVTEEEVRNITRILQNRYFSYSRKKAGLSEAKKVV